MRTELKVRVSEVTLATGVSSGLDTLGQFELHDLVSVDPRTVGCVIRIERNTLFLVDQNGQKIEKKPQQVELKRMNQRSTALDVDHNEIRKDAMIKVIDGEYLLVQRFNGYLTTTNGPSYA